MRPLHMLTTLLMLGSQYIPVLPNQGGLTKYIHILSPL